MEHLDEPPSQQNCPSGSSIKCGKRDRGNRSLRGLLFGARQSHFGVLAAACVHLGK